MPGTEYLGAIASTSIVVALVQQGNRGYLHIINIKDVTKLAKCVYSEINSVQVIKDGMPPAESPCCAVKLPKDIAVSSAKITFLSATKVVIVSHGFTLVDLATGEVRRLPGKASVGIKSIACGDDFLVYSCESGKVYCIDFKNPEFSAARIRVSRPSSTASSAAAAAEDNASSSAPLMTSVLSRIVVLTGGALGHRWIRVYRSASGIKMTTLSPAHPIGVDPESLAIDMATDRCSVMALSGDKMVKVRPFSPAAVVAGVSRTSETPVNDTTAHNPLTIMQEKFSALADDISTSMVDATTYWRSTSALNTGLLSFIAPSAELDVRLPSNDIVMAATLVMAGKELPDSFSLETVTDALVRVVFSACSSILRFFSFLPSFS
jgi:hypothetical protein